MSKFDDIIQQKANEHQAPVPAGAWENIIKEKKKRRFIFFWWTFGILLCAFSIIGSYIYNNSGSNKVDSIQTEPAIAKTNIPTEDKTITPQTQPVTTEKSNNQKETGNNPATTNESTENEPGNNEIKDPAKAAKKTMAGDNTINDKANVAVKNNKNSKEKPAGKFSANAVNMQTATSVGKQNVQKKPVVKKEESDESLAKYRKTMIKEKGNSKTKIQAGETETLAENEDKVKNIDEIVVAETKNATSKQMNDVITKDNDQPVTVPDSKNMATAPTSTKKDLVVDSVQTKQALTTPVENKKAQAVVNKPVREHSWFIDLGIAPVLPIQQYDQSTTFSRTHLSNNNLSVFSGSLVSTSIDPSVAFSLSVRKAMNKKLSVGLGLQYLQLKEHVTISGTETNTKYTIVDRLVNNVNGPQLVSDTVETITEGERKITAINSYTFISIPVFVQYDLVQNKSWSFGLVGGAYINVYGKYKNEINENSDAQLVASSQTADQNSSIGIALYGGFRLGKRINKRIELFGTPSVTWALGNQNIKNSLLNKKIQQVGLNLGVSYRLN